MSKITSEQFIELITKSEIADSKDVAELEKTIRRENDGSLPQDPVEVAKRYEDAGLITRWHSEKLLLGKYKGYFLGKHKLLGHIGRGGMSTVYLAVHTAMGAKRAIKVLPRSKLSKSSYLARFQREAQAIAALDHPNIVRAYDIDNQNDTHYIVMEYVEGSDLQNLVKNKGPLAYDKAAEYIAEAAKGLHHAHEAGLIHRDVKPANVLVSKSGEVKLLDLGLALFADESQASLTIDYNDKVLGTADYLAPEQALNSHNVDPRADMYGLGCTLYFVLTGHPPFPDGSIAERIAKHQKLMPEDIRKDRPDVPGELEGICFKMMQKDPRFRYNDCKEVVEVLEKWLAAYRSRVPVKQRAGISDGGNARAGSSSVDLDSCTSLPKPETDTETVSNRASETLSSGSLINLSASDSGVLHAIANKESQSDAGSAIDLQMETQKRRLQDRKRRANEEAKRATGKQAASVARQKPVAKDVRSKAAVASTTTVQQVATNPKISMWLLIVGLIVMFILAVALGIVIERLTAKSNPTVLETPAADSLELDAMRNATDSP